MTGQSGPGTVVIVGGTRGIGREVARHYAERGRRVVLTGRHADGAATAAAEVGEGVHGLGLDLARPAELAGRLREVPDVAHLVLCAIDRDENTVTDYDIERATRLATLKLVGYTEVVHALLDRMAPESSIVVFGGLARSRPYPGSTTVTTVNGAVSTMVRTMAVELAPMRVNAIHPAVVGDSPYWKDKPAAALDALRARTPIGRLVSMADIVHAVVFLLENRGVNGINLDIDGGWLLT